MFSSVKSTGLPAKIGAKASVIASRGPLIDRVCKGAPKAWATAAASSKETWLVYSDGNITQCTCSEPSASAATVATMAESIPPDRPRTTEENPVLYT